MTPMLMMLAAAAAPASEADLRADLRCVAAFSLAVSKAEGDQRSALVSGTWYYVGRIDARQPGYDFTAGLTAMATGGADARPTEADFTRCAEVVRVRGGDLEHAGQALMDLGAKLKAEGK